MNYNNQFPWQRLRRTRKTQAIRDLVAETSVTTHDLIYPIFIQDMHTKSEAIHSMPGQFRYSLDGMLEVAEKSLHLGIKALAIFPANIPHKDLLAKESYNDNGLIPRAIRLLKQHFPELLVFSDVALDPYTIHGHDGILDKQNVHVLNDLTNEILAKQALCHAYAGVDFVSPSDMMDGRISMIRRSLEANKFFDVGIMSYACKYASKFYGPFRDAIGSSNKQGLHEQCAVNTISKAGYQMNPANSNEALHEATLDIAEGADIVMVKPGLAYLDILYRIKQQLQKPTAIYQVSGEYTMLKLAGLNGALNYEEALMETMLCFKRAGADIIYTYAAHEVAKLLNNGS